MRVKKLTSTGVLLVAMAVLTSSCFSMRQFYWSNPNPASGGSSFAVQKMYPTTSGSLVTYEFVMVGWAGSGITTSKRRFDITGNYGGPYNMVQDNTLRSILLGGGECQNQGIDVADITGMNWKLFRTQVEITTGSGNEALVARQSMRVNFPDEGEATRTFVFVTGSWSDDGDGLPEGDDDVFFCSGMMFTTIAVG
jgi:hypothetical protein